MAGTVTTPISDGSAILPQPSMKTKMGLAFGIRADAPKRSTSNLRVPCAVQRSDREILQRLTKLQRMWLPMCILFSPWNRISPGPLSADASI